MFRLFVFFAIVAGAFLLMKAVLIAVVIVAMAPVFLVARFLVRPFLAPHLRTPLVDPLNGFKPIKK